MAEGRGGLLSAGGILSIIVGVFELLVGAAMVALKWIDIPFWPPSRSGLMFGDILGMTEITTHLLIIGAIIAIIGVLFRPRRPSGGNKG